MVSKTNEMMKKSADENAVKMKEVQDEAKK